MASSYADEGSPNLGCTVSHLEFRASRAGTEVTRHGEDRKSRSFDCVDRLAINSAQDGNLYRAMRNITQLSTMAEPQNIAKQYRP